LHGWLLANGAVLVDSTSQRAWLSIDIRELSGRTRWLLDETALQGLAKVRARMEWFQPTSAAGCGWCELLGRLPGRESGQQARYLA
jgi:hypothetical protein